MLSPALIMYHLYKRKNLYLGIKKHIVMLVFYMDVDEGEDSSGDESRGV